MNKYFIALLFPLLLLVGCSGNKEKIPEVQLKTVTVKDLVQQPDSYILEPPKQKQRIPMGYTQGQAAPIIASNGLIEQDNVNKLRLAQQYIRNLFK